MKCFLIASWNTGNRVHRLQSRYGKGEADKFLATHSAKESVLSDAEDKKVRLALILVDGHVAGRFLCPKDAENAANVD